MKLGIISAIKEELDQSIANLCSPKIESIGKRTFYSGELHGLNVVLALSGMGKVSASTTTNLLIHKYGVTHILFTGVAGSACPEVNVGDVVVASHLLQHDLDASPLVPRYEVPGLDRALLACDAALKQSGIDAVNAFLKRKANSRLHTGLIASGDQFIDDKQQLIELAAEVSATFNQPLLCVEMEGAAVAQVCVEHQLPFCVIRIISDKADESAAIDFAAFIQQIAAPCSDEILRAFCQQYVSS